MVTLYWFSSFWCHFDLVKWTKFGVSGHFSENAWREWPEILHADISWPPSELIRLWSWSVNFPNVGAILTKWNGSNLGFPGICWRTHEGIGLKFCLLMYLDHLQIWLDYSHHWLILFYFWHYFDLVKQVKFWVSGHIGHALWIFLNMVPLWLKLVIFVVSGHYPENV